MSSQLAYAEPPVGADIVEPVVVRPLSVAEASRMVAGVTHLARALIDAQRAGARQATVMLAPSPALQTQIAEELDRAGCPLTITWQAHLEPAGAAPGEGLGDPRALRDQVLRATGKPTDGLVSRRLNRPVSRWITTGVLEAFPNVRPWQLTLVTAAFGLAMFAALVLGGPLAVVYGGLLYHITSVIDGVDGEIARATFRSSRAGAAMDTAVDMATNVLFALGLTIALTQQGGVVYAYVGGAALALLLGGLASMALLVRLTRAEPSFDLLKVVFSRRFASGWMAPVSATTRVITSRDFFALAAAVLAVSGLGWAMPWMMLGGIACWVVFIGWGAVLIFGPRRLSVRIDDNGATAPAE